MGRKLKDLCYNWVFDAALCLRELVSLCIKLKFEVGFGNGIPIIYRYSLTLVPLQSRTDQTQTLNHCSGELVTLTIIQFPNAAVHLFSWNLEYPPYLFPIFSPEAFCVFCVQPCSAILCCIYSFFSIVQKQCWNKMKYIFWSNSCETSCHDRQRSRTYTHIFP